MNKSVFASVMALFLSACTNTQSVNVSENAAQESQQATMDVTKTNLQHHHWILTKVNGEPVKVVEGFLPPTLEIGEEFTANGHSGCNRYFGQAELEGDQFRVQGMGSTMMACPEPSMELEQLVTDVLSGWSKVTLTENAIMLNGNANNLEFKLQDWVY
ncbi:heat-shock protein HslJ [Veronia nyctiphanis]|uniref:Heat-shock protein HslJ n=1 Tax=Veronia nyctiphanis TaxID=1278244 RepID=A0A4Q0YXB7_9GAMM|nr:META domain-containing protein [Veronia nyctiphanis]RXJ74954.1 heat-shock protein HslJ [Veronia nyctiphanis]